MMDKSIMNNASIQYPQSIMALSSEPLIPPSGPDQLQDWLSYNHLGSQTYFPYARKAYPTSAQVFDTNLKLTPSQHQFLKRTIPRFVDNFDNYLRLGPSQQQTPDHPLGTIFQDHKKYAWSYASEISNLAMAPSHGYSGFNETDEHKASRSWLSSCGPYMQPTLVQTDQRKNEGGKIFACTRCAYTSQRKADCEAHKLTHSPKPRRARVACSHGSGCIRTFNRKTDMERHVQNVRQGITKLRSSLIGYRFI